MSRSICQQEQIAAYVDGELDSESRSVLERHLESCLSCASELRAQRLFLCELDAVLAGGVRDHSVPDDFAQRVAAYAESDMSGVRNRAEHQRALQLCVLLGLAAFVLLGVAVGEFIGSTFTALITKATTLTRFAVGTLYDTAASATVISRVVGKSFILQAQLPGILPLLLILAVLLLSLLIASYHRTRVME